MRLRSCGFVLLELFAAIALLGGAILIAGQWWQAEAQRNLRLQWIDDAQQVAASLALFWINEQRPPVDVAELISSGYLQPVSEPWQQSWQLETGTELSHITLLAPDEARAVWLSGKLPQSFNVGNQVRMAVWRPYTVTGNDNYLHRVAVAGAPQLNQMETALDMNGNDLQNARHVQVDTIVTVSMQAGDATLQSASAQSLVSNTINATYVTTAETSMAQLQSQLTDLKNLWLECQNTGGCQ